MTLQELLEKVPWETFRMKFCEHFRPELGQKCDPLWNTLRSILAQGNDIKMKKVAQIAPFLDDGSKVLDTLLDMLTSGYVPSSKSNSHS